MQTSHVPGASAPFLPLFPHPSPPWPSHPFRLSPFPPLSSLPFPSP